MPAAGDNHPFELVGLFLELHLRDGSQCLHHPGMRLGLVLEITQPVLAEFVQVLVMVFAVEYPFPDKPHETGLVHGGVPYESGELVVVKVALELRYAAVGQAAGVGAVGHLANRFDHVGRYADEVSMAADIVGRDDVLHAHDHRLIWLPRPRTRQRSEDTAI